MSQMGRQWRLYKEVTGPCTLRDLLGTAQAKGMNLLTESQALLAQRKYQKPGTPKQGKNDARYSDPLHMERTEYNLCSLPLLFLLPLVP